MYRDQADFFSYYRRLQEQVRGEILRESEEQLLCTDSNEMAKYIYEQYAVTPIEIDKGRETNWDLQDYLKDIPANQREDFYQGVGAYPNFSCQRAVIEVPIISNRHLSVISGLRATTHLLSYPDRDFNWGNDRISRSFETKGYGFEMDEQRIANEVNSILQSINDTINWKNQSIEKGNKELYAFIWDTIEKRKGEITQNKEKLSTLTKTVSIPLKKKASAGAQVVRLAHTPLVQRVKPRPTLPEEYVLDEARVNDIITLLDNQARSFEQTPKSFKELREEDLRDILLSNLNSVFEGGATGETFSKTGKTDIYLKIAKGNILICECKIWGGKALYGETIDQLRGYLTWRHNYGIVITFMKTKDFTKVLEEGEGAIHAHSSYINGFHKVGNTHYVSNHKVDDDDKQVKIHHLFYHLYYR